MENLECIQIENYSFYLNTIRVNTDYDEIKRVVSQDQHWKVENEKYYQQLFVPVLHKVYFMLTYFPWDKMAAISQTTISILFSWMKILEFRLKFHWSLFLRVQMTII